MLPRKFLLDQFQLFWANGVMVHPELWELQVSFQHEPLTHSTDIYSQWAPLLGLGLLRAWTQTPWKSCQSGKKDTPPPLFEPCMVPGTEV